MRRAQGRRARPRLRAVRPARLGGLLALSLGVALAVLSWAALVRGAVEAGIDGRWALLAAATAAAVVGLVVALLMLRVLARAALAGGPRPRHARRHLR